MADRGRTLLALARSAIAAAFGAPPLAAPEEAWLQQFGATFVTLTQDGELRGCIGSLEAWRPLADDVRQNALAAAFRDMRFAPLVSDELAYTNIEVSLLTPQEPILFTSEQDALARLRPGIDGVVLEYGHHRSTFLPQVWSQLPEPKAFMARLKVKAGLTENFWSPQVKLYRYGVEKWKE